MNLIPFFKLVKKDTVFYSPLYTEIKFQQVRKFNPMDENSPNIIEFKTVTNKTVLFNNEGKPIVFHPDGEMIYETTLGECMISYKNTIKNESI